MVTGEQNLRATDRQGRSRLDPRPFLDRVGRRVPWPSRIRQWLNHARYGQGFVNGIQHSYPGGDYDDLMAGVDAAIAKGFIDERNLFVCGGSGGGVAERRACTTDAASTDDLMAIQRSRRSGGACVCGKWAVPIESMWRALASGTNRRHQRRRAG